MYLQTNNNSKEKEFLDSLEQSIEVAKRDKQAGNDSFHRNDFKKAIKEYNRVTAYTIFT